MTTADVTFLKEPLGPDGMILTARGELDVATAPALREHLRDAHDRGVRRMVLDLCDVTFIDSLTLAAIVGARTRLGDDGAMAIATCHHYVLLIFEAGGLDGLLDVVETRDEAVALVQG
jgi:anti-sigma B factor antagonist